MGGGGRKKRVYSVNFSYLIFKNHCQRFIHDFDLGEGGNFHVLAKRGEGKFFFYLTDTLRLILMQFGSIYGHSVLAHAQNNWDSTF